MFVPLFSHMSLKKKKNTGPENKVTLLLFKFNSSHTYVIINVLNILSIRYPFRISNKSLFIYYIVNETKH